MRRSGVGVRPNILSRGYGHARALSLRTARSVTVDRPSEPSRQLASRKAADQHRQGGDDKDRGEQQPRALRARGRHALELEHEADDREDKISDSTRLNVMAAGPSNPRKCIKGLRTGEQPRKRCSVWRNS